MSGSALAAKSVSVGECLLVSAVDPTVSVDLRSFMMSCSIFENLLSSTLSGEIVVNDDAGLSRMLVGFEFVRIRFSVFDPSTSRWRMYPASNDETLMLRVVAQTNRQQKSDGVEVYTLVLASPTYATSLAMRISRSYRDKKVEQIIQDILQNDIKTPRPFFAEATQQTTNFTIPYYKPLDAIEFFTSRAITPEKRSTYLFYESLDGFHFKSLSTMITEGRAARAAKTVPRIRQYRTGLSDVRDTALTLRAENIDVVHTFDMLQYVNDGYFSSRVIGVDVLSGQYRDTRRTSGDSDFVSKPRLNDRPLYPPNDPLRPYAPDSRVFVVPTTSLSMRNDALQATNPEVAENFIETTVDARNRELLELQMQCVRVKVSGAPNLNIGRVVWIDVPLPGGGAKEPRDPMRSGLHLIVAVRHDLINIGGAFSYDTTLEACSDSITQS